MIRYSNNISSNMIESDSSLPGAGAGYHGIHGISSFVPEMTDYRCNGYYVTSMDNDIVHPVYNAFNSNDELHCSLGAFTSEKIISIAFPRRKTVMSMAMDFIGNFGAFGIAISYDDDNGIAHPISSFSASVARQQDYSNFLAIDGLFSNVQSGVENMKVMLFTRSILAIDNLSIHFIPYSETSSVFSIRSIKLMESEQVCYFDEPFSNSFNYQNTSYNASFGTISGMPCIEIRNGYLLYQPSMFYNLSCFSLSFSFNVEDNGSCQCLFSKTRRCLDVSIRNSSVFVEMSGISKGIRVQGLFSTWHRFLLNCCNGKSSVFVDGVLAFEIAKAIDFSETYGNCICIGCREDSDNARSDYMDGGIRDFKIVGGKIGQSSLQRL